jgi:hypothetical protein
MGGPSKASENSIRGEVPPTVDLPRHAGFSEFVGQWTEDAGFDEMVASLLQVDVGRWEGNPGK